MGYTDKKSKTKKDSTAGHLEMPYRLVLLAAFKIVSTQALLTHKNLT
jgi:hypothetical protein